MSKPTDQQRAQVISEHIKAVGKANLTVYEVALTLDGRHLGMSDSEFEELQMELRPAVEAARADGLRDIWGDR